MDNDYKTVKTTEVEHSYDDQVPATYTQKLPTPKNDFFISHASTNADNLIEKNFAIGLKQLLERNFKIFIDVDPPIIDVNTIQHECKKSNYGIFICSQTFFNRYNDDSLGSGTQMEVKHFTDRRISFPDEHSNCIIIIAYNVDREYLTQNIPLFNFVPGGNIIHIRTANGKELDKLIEEAAMGITSRINKCVVRVRL